MKFDISAFCRHVAQYGLLLEPSKVKIDGKAHNCKLIDNKSGSSGSYVIYPSGVAAFKSWREPDKIYKYYSPGATLTTNSEFASQMREQNKQQSASYYAVAQSSYKKFQSIPFSTRQSEYVNRKKIAVFDAKIDLSGNLVIPYYNAKGFISTLQTIKSDGSKLFEKGGQVSGCFHKIGFSKIDKKYTGFIYMGEGFATMASIYLAIQMPCVVAASCGNFVPVLSVLSVLYPHATFIICADNDVDKLNNAGLEAAKKCQEQFNCSIVIPSFNNEDNDSLSDFNDLHVFYGISEVKNQLTKSLPLKPSKFVKFTYSLADYSLVRYQNELNDIRNYFQNFGMSWSGDLSAIHINNLHISSNIYDAVSVTNIFLNDELVLVEQLQSSSIFLRVVPELFDKFIECLNNEKMKNLIELNQRFNEKCNQVQLLEQEIKLLKNESL